MNIRRRVAVLAVAACCLSVAGCAAAGPSASDAAAVASQFSSAVAAGDATLACQLLSPGAAKAVAASSSGSCSEGLSSLKVPGGGAAVREEAYGRAAFVQLEGDTVFLTISGGTWKVRAAGCTPNGDAPYDCIVKGD